MLPRSKYVATFALGALLLCGSALSAEPALSTPQPTSRNEAGARSELAFCPPIEELGEVALAIARCRQMQSELAAARLELAALRGLRPKRLACGVSGLGGIDALDGGGVLAVGLGCTFRLTK
jgi:hypothetical protein